MSALQKIYLNQLQEAETEQVDLNPFGFDQ
jgi:hypothetical protein